MKIKFPNCSFFFFFITVLSVYILTLNLNSPTYYSSSQHSTSIKLFNYYLYLPELNSNNYSQFVSQITRLVRRGSVEGVFVYPSSIKIDNKTLDTWILEADAEEGIKVFIVANEEIRGTRWIDWGKGLVYVDGEPIPLDPSHETFDELITRGDREELIQKFKDKYPDKEIIAVLPNGNTIFNDWFVSYVDGKLLHNAREPVFERKYSSLVVWKDGHISIEDIRFEEGETVGQIKVKNIVTGEDITNQVLYTTYGQRLVRDGDTVNLVDIYEQFDDLSHLFYFPLIPVEGREVIAGPLAGKMHEDKSLVKDALEGNVINFDVSWIANDELRKRLNQSGYKEVASSQGIVDEGDYSIQGDTLSIKLIRNQYRHFVVGVKDNKLVTISILGTSGSYGATIEEAAEIARRNGLEDAILVCNGRDVWLQYRGNWIEDTGRGGISSVIILAKDNPGAVDVQQQFKRTYDGIWKATQGLSNFNESDIKENSEYFLPSEPKLEFQGTTLVTLIPETLSEKIANEQKEFKKQLGQDIENKFYFVPKEDLHITIQGIREVSEEALSEEVTSDDTKSAIKKVVSQFPSFKISIQRFNVTTNGVVIMEGYVNNENIFNLQENLRDAFPSIIEKPKYKDPIFQVTVAILVEPLTTEEFDKFIKILGTMRDINIGEYLVDKVIYCQVKGNTLTGRDESKDLVIKLEGLVR